MRKICFFSFLVFIACALCPVNTYCQPSIGGYNVYYGSLHNHCAFSDGQGTPEQAYTYARNTAQLDFFGLSDHSEMLTSTEWTTTKNAANNANQDGAFAAFYGFEWSSFWSYGHVSVINTDDYCSYFSTTSFNALLSWINARNGIAFFNHPGWDALAYSEFDHFTDTPSDKFVGIELWNDQNGFSTYYYNDGFYSNDGNKGYYDEALIRGWRIGASGSDDNHSATWGTATPMRMAVLANVKSRADILNALTARRFFSTEDNNLALSFKINGAEMGTTVTAGNFTADILASDGENEFFTQVQLIKNGAVINTWYIYDANPSISQPLTCISGEYYYVKVTQADGDEAISSPVFISGQTNQAPVVAITSPVEGATFIAGSTIPVSADASDSDGTISNVEFYQGAVKLGEDNTAPYNYNWSNVPAGNYALTAKAYDNLGASVTSSIVNISVNTPSMVTVSSGIGSGTDDVEEGINGVVVLNGDDLELVYDSKKTGNQTVGLLFRNLGIPVGADITNAYIQFTADERTTASCSLKIEGEDSDNASSFANTAYNVSGRTRTSSNVTWVPVAWKTVGASGSGERTPDISAIISEIVSRPNWNPAGNLAILITGTGKRTAESYEGYPAKAPLLYIEYATAKSQPFIIAEPFTDAQTGLSEVSIKLYPNPAGNEFRLRLESPGTMQSISIYNTSGSLIYAVDPGSDVTETLINCSSFPAGLYFIRIETGYGSGTAKLLKK